LAQGSEALFSFLHIPAWLRSGSGSCLPLMFMINLRGLIILSLFLPGYARRSFHIEDSRHDAQQQIKTLSKDFAVTAEGKDALLPTGLKPTRFRTGKKVLPQGKASPRFPSAKMYLDGTGGYDMDGYGRYGGNMGGYGGYDMEGYGEYGRRGYDMDGYGKYGGNMGGYDGYDMDGYGRYGRRGSPRRGYDMDGRLGGPPRAGEWRGGEYGQQGYDMGGHPKYGRQRYGPSGGTNGRRWYDKYSNGRRSGTPYMSEENAKNAEIAKNDAPNTGKVATALAGVASRSAGGADD